MGAAVAFGFRLPSCLPLRECRRVAAARKLFTGVFYALRDGEVRSLTARSRALEAG